MLDFSGYDFAPIIRYEGEWHIFDLTDTYDPEFIEKKQWGIGRYNEKRPAMYLAPQYEGRRNIHMGIDFWTPAGEPVFAFHDGVVCYTADHNQRGNYGPTIVTRHILNGTELYALFGHLSRESLEMTRGMPIGRGERIARVGPREVNGGWVPHLHFQLSVEDPGAADMPGVVAEEDREEALRKFPDPRLIVGDLY
ncbi:MAG: peptidoglycan DD-metalloendopeptidase family protein [Balneolaceae bacterium]|nr:peptidoglycan DD-metalloendopeptidase family protein [Balneolaceae bacterium]